MVVEDVVEEERGEGDGGGWGGGGSVGATEGTEKALEGGVLFSQSHYSSDSSSALLLTKETLGEDRRVVALVGLIDDFLGGGFALERLAIFAAC